MEIITYPEEIAKDVLKLLELENYGPESLIEAERYFWSVNEDKPVIEPRRIHLYTCILGCFLGECIRAKIGGEWVEEDGYPHLKLVDGYSDPIRRARLFVSGEDDTTLFEMYIGVTHFTINHMQNAEHTQTNE